MRWRIRLGREAENDFADILISTRDRFGFHRVGLYKDVLVAALATLESGPGVAGSQARDEILPGLRSLHVARDGRRGRHVILYRMGEGLRIDVVRILHDSMDFVRHVKREPG